ncbi:MAG: FecR family protein [Bacteroidales bacterium]
MKQIPWDLVISKLKGILSAKEEKEWQKWISNNNNQLLFDEIQALWNEIQSKVIDYKVDMESCWQELQRRIAASEDILKEIEKEKELKAESVRKTYLSSFQKYAAVAAVFLIFLSGAFYMGLNMNFAEVAEQTYTSWGGKSEIILPDATNVWVQSNTSLSYQTNFHAKNRIVKLDGQAFFDVTHDQENPFIVEAGDLKIVVHGTKFNVEASPEMDDIIVSLQEGSVSLESNGRNCFLAPGEIATFNKRTHNLIVEQGDVNLAASWADDEFEFSNSSLGYVAKYLSKWYNVRINLSEDMADKYKYTFKLRSEPLEEILRIMSRLHPIEYSFDEKNVVTIREN